MKCNKIDVFTSQITVFMIFLTWYLYSLDENMQKLTETRDGKELSGVVIIKQINGPPLPWAKDPSKRRLKAVILSQPPPPPAKILRPPPPRPRGSPGHTPLP